MKKILYILLCVVTLLPCFTMLASAAEEEKDIVLEELKNFTINGKAFDAADYPVDASKTTPELLTIREVGVDPDRPATEWIADYELYFYFYDPAASFEHWEGSVYMTFDEGKPDTITEDMRRYFSDVRMSADGLFIRAKLEQMGPYSGAFDNLQDRVYHIHRYSLAYTYFDDYIFCVTGSDKNKDLQYFDGGELTMELDLHGSVWRSEDPTAEDLNRYHEFATVYFTIPSEIYNQYDYIESIKAEFKQFLSSPIIVSNSATLNGMSVDVMRSGLLADVYMENVPTLEYGQYQYWSDSNNAALYTAPIWIYNPSDSDRNRYGEYYPSKFDEYYNSFTDICDSLSYYFYDADIEVDQYNNFYEVVSTDEFKSYLEGYMKAYHSGETFESGLAPELYDEYDPYVLVYKYIDIYKDVEYQKVQTEGLTFWQLLGAAFGHVYSTKYSENVKKFEIIENPASIASQYNGKLDELSRQLKIGKKDAAGFLEYLKNADGVVVLLRFATSQFECREVNAYTYEKSGIITRKNYIEDGTTWMCRMPFYRDIDVTTVTFRRGEKLFRYTVIADPLDHIDGGVGVKKDWDDHMKDLAGSGLKDNVRELLEALLFILKVIAVIAIIAVIIYLGVKLFTAGGWLIEGGAKVAKGAKDSFDRSLDQIAKRKRRLEKERAAAERKQKKQKKRKKPKKEE